MQASQTPILVPLAFAANGTKNTIPEASQIGITNGAASLNDGFPPLTFTPVAAGGVPPFGADFNGVLNLITQTIRWKHAGGQFGYNSAFANDTNVGGYPKGALLLRADLGGLWLNQTDSNTSNPDTGGAGWTGMWQGHGQCRLSVASATQLNLAPFSGNMLVINGAPQQIPAAGITLSNTGLAASTVYYVYAYMNAGTMTLEASTTTHATAANGVETKSGDTTRTLVGMIATNSSSQFVDSPTQRFCLNWFNRRILYGNTNAPALTTTSTTIVELSTSIRVSFLRWADEWMYASIAGGMSSSVANGNMSVQGWIGPGNIAFSPAQGAISTVASQSTPFNTASSNLSATTEGSIWYTTLGAQIVSGGGTASFSVNSSIVLRG